MVVTVISTASSFVKPTANAYALNCFSIHLFYILATEMKWYENGLFCMEVHFFKRPFFSPWNVFLSLSFIAALTRKLYDWPSCQWYCGCSPSPVGWATVLAAAFGRDLTSATCTLYGENRAASTLFFLSFSLYLHVCWFCHCPFIVCIFWYQFHSSIINQTHPHTRLRIWTLTHEVNPLCPLLPPGLRAVEIILPNHIVIFYESGNV